MINRRNFLGYTAGAASALAFSPQLLRAFQSASGQLIQRTIPSSGESLPVISFGPRPFDGPEPSDGAPLEEIFRTLLDHGVKVVDVLHGGPDGELAARKAAASLKVQDKFFWTTPYHGLVPSLPGYGPPPSPTPEAVRSNMEEKFTTFGVKKIDLVMVGAGADVTTPLAVLREMKKEGRVRYIGVHTLAFPPGAPMPPFGELESILRNEQIDFVASDYSVGDRRIEETILPLAQERKVGVMAYFPFDRRRIFERAKNKPLPEWAAEFDAKTWAQFFLKYVVSHPGVTVVRTGTTKAAHMLDNIGGGIGRLPGEATRKRMAELVDSLPPTPPPTPKPKAQPKTPPPPPVVVPAAVLDRYVGAYEYVLLGQTVTFRRDGDKLLMKSGNMPDVALVPRSETRFEGPWDMVFEFELDKDQKVTSAVLQQGPNRIPLERK